jgi:hypothetical protein
MGLYDHNGLLLINNHPSTSFTPAQLHARTTVCFQDHSKYSLTLRENVGIGYVPLIHSVPDVKEAIVKGGAEGILARVGMEGMLDRHGVPDAAGQDGGEGGGEGAGEEEGPDGHPPPPPGREGPSGGRGGFGGRGGAPGAGVDLFGTVSRRTSPPPGAPSHQEMMMEMEMRRGDLKSSDRQPLSGGQWQRASYNLFSFLSLHQADRLTVPSQQVSLSLVHSFEQEKPILSSLSESLPCF